MVGLMDGTRAPRVVRDEKRVLRTLNAFAVDLMAIRSAEDLFWHVAREVAGRLGFEDCVVYRLEEDDGGGAALVQVAALGDKNPHDRAILNPLRIPVGHGVTGRCARDAAPVVIADLAGDDDYIPDAAPARSEISVPILSEGRVVGVIDSEHPEPRAFGDAELEVLTTVAAMTGAKLDLLREAETSAERYRDLLRSHARLAEETERRRAAEAELFEARRLEAIGRLTGGFAHAFNNLLTAVSGHLDLAEVAGLEGDAAEAVGEARDAAAAGARMIRDMLAFSRRSRLAPERVDPGPLVRDCASATGAEAAPAPDAWAVHVDPAVAAVAVTNLLLNAREAGGPDRVRVETLNVVLGAGAEAGLVPGRYVRIDVADAGRGVADALRDRVFDPFFTTKGAGRGTGLGLSMAQGFALQSGGGIALVANDRGGTTARLWLPAAEG